MPLRHSPPPSSSSKSYSEMGAQVQLSCDSDTPSERSGGATAYMRTKRRREQDDDLKDLKSEMRGLFTNLSNSVEQRFNEIKQQNNELQMSLQFISDKYDTVLEKLQTLEEDSMKDRKYIETLEDKIESLERKCKATGIEVRNVPRMTEDDKKPETKQEMCTIIKTIAKAVDIDLKDLDVKDIYRVNSNKTTVKPIIVELNSVLMKENIIKAVKIFNKGRPIGDKLNSSHLKISGPPRPVFLSETLTFNTQKLFFMTREFARENQFSYCWTSRGLIYLRKADGQPLFRINSEADIHKIKSSI